MERGEQMTKRYYTWFIRPLDNHTNEVIFRELDALALSEESLNQVQVCEGKTIYNAIQIPTEMIDYLLKSRDQLGIRFKLYVREGNGKIREANWINSRQRKRAKKPVEN